MEINRRTLLGAAGALGASVAASGLKAQAAQPRQRVIDAHTHMFTDGWVAAVRAYNDPDTRIVQGERFLEADYRGARIIRFSPEMTDWALRIRNMDAGGVDVAVISLTTPSVHIGDEAFSTALARQVNDDFAEAQRTYPERIRWLCALPWEYPAAAIAELERCRANGAVGVGTTTNIRGKMLNDPQFRPVWDAIHQTRTPVFIHPTTPYIDIEAAGMSPYGLANTVGFTADTSLCFLRMILDGFLDDYPNLDLIACHGGGTLPYLAGRADQMWSKGSSAGRRIQQPPSTYLRRLWYDAIVYDQPTLEFLVARVGADRVLYGSDYPFLIGDMVGVLSRVDALPADQARAIRGANAARLFNL